MGVFKTFSVFLGFQTVLLFLNKWIGLGLSWYMLWFPTISVVAAIIVFHKKIWR